MRKSVAISVQQVSFNDDQVLKRTHPLRQRISFSDEEFRKACDELAWKDPRFCARQIECDQAESTRRLELLIDNDPLINETVAVAKAEHAPFSLTRRAA